MIIIWKHIRTAKMYTDKQLARGYTNRYIHLLDPVYWVNRDHCRLEGTPRKKTTKGRYLFVWISQYYTDQNGIKKKSIIPKYKLCIRSDTIRDKIRSYKNKIKKFYWKFILYIIKLHKVNPKHKKQQKSLAIW